MARGMRRMGWMLGLLVFLVGGLSGTAWFATAPHGPAAGTESARRLEAGPHPVASVDRVFVDASRPTAANGDYAGAPSRTLEATIWYPEGDAGDHPLVVHSHGFMSMRDETLYAVRGLASRGYVVVSADFPLTNFSAPGGPQIRDVAQQPGDVSFLIDSMLALGGADKPFEGRLDPERIGAMGLSLGGLTTTLLAFHPTLRDPRIRAAISIGGPAQMFLPEFFRNADLPFLMIAATEDAMVDYANNAMPLPDLVARGGLVSIERGSHTGFANVAEPAFRFAHHPDSIGCGALMDVLDIEPGNEAEFMRDLGGATQGMNLAVGEASRPCQKSPLPEAIHPGRQHMITRLAVVDFFESVFATDAQQRDMARAHLETGLARDFPEASFRAAARAPELRTGAGAPAGPPSI